MPHLVAILVFITVTYTYFGPQLRGEVIDAHDQTQWQGMSKSFVDHHAKYGEYPQWDGRMFGGMPAVMTFFKLDGQIFTNFHRDLQIPGYPAGTILIAMLFFYIMLVMWGVNPWLSIAGGLAYGLSTYFMVIIGAGHETKTEAMAYAPMLLASVFWAFRKNMWVGSGLAAFFGALELAAGHPQISYYFLMVLLAYWISELVRSIKQKLLPRFAKTTALLLLAAVIAGGSMFSHLWYIREHSPVTIRGGSEIAVEQGQKHSGLDLEYATAWSYGISESMNMYIPGFTGGSSMEGFSPDGEVAAALRPYNQVNLAAHLPAYWGPQPMTSGPVYIGAVLFFLFVLGLIILGGGMTWWVGIITALAVMLSWGKNFMPLTELFFNIFPGYSSFRTVSMILVIVEWSVPFLGLVALGKIAKGDIPWAKTKQALKLSLYITGGVALFFALFGGMLFNFTASSDAMMGLPDDILAAMRAERASMLRSDSWRSLALVAATFGVIWLFCRENKVKLGWLALSLAALVCIDLIPVDLRFLPQDKFTAKSRTGIKPTEADLQILSDTTPGFRVWNRSVSTFNDATTSYFHRSVGGYHGAKLARYQDLIDLYLSRGDMNIYNMLDTRYVIDRDGQAKFNPGANGPAWMVHRAVKADGPMAEITTLGTLDTKREAVIGADFWNKLGLPALPGGAEIELTEQPSDTIFMDEYRSNYQKYTYSAAERSLGVFSEIYYDKGWKGYIDGEEVPVLRADYLLRALVLPEGQHTVEFRFAPPNYKAVSAVALIFSLMAIFAFLAAVTYVILKAVKK